jgi:hypothetical protein
MPAKEPPHALAAPVGEAPDQTRHDADRAERVRPGERDTRYSRERPLLMVDIDGVISLFGRDGHAPWAPHPASGPSQPGARDGSAPDGSFHTIDGIPHFLSHDAAAHLSSLTVDFDLVWASGWEEKADEHLPRLLGLPAGLPFLRFARSPGKGNAHWKLAAIDAHAGSRPLAWIDDALTDACHAWADARAAPTLLVQTGPERGLTATEAQLLVRWARELAWAAP